MYADAHAHTDTHTKKYFHQKGTGVPNLKVKARNVQNKPGKPYCTTKQRCYQRALSKEAGTNFKRFPPIKMEEFK